MMLTRILPLLLVHLLTASAAPPDLAGVYQAIPNDITLPGGLKNSGSPNDAPLLPAAASQIKDVDLKQDPARACKPIGPFRMMARDRVKIELVPANGMLVILFEDLSHGHMRIAYFDPAHHPKSPESWHGNSLGRWDGDSLIIDTSGFNDRTWLNDRGVQHSSALRLRETIRPVLNGKYLEYQVTAEDPPVLAKAFSYRRYFAKLETDISEDICEDQ